MGKIIDLNSYRNQRHQARKKFVKSAEQGRRAEGFDFGIKGSKITGSLDYYERTTTDLLMNRSLPNITGFSSVIANLGEVANNGVELTLNTENYKTNNFTWRTSFSAWTNDNKILVIRLV